VSACLPVAIVLERQYCLACQVVAGCALTVQRNWLTMLPKANVQIPTIIEEDNIRMFTSAPSLQHELEASCPGFAALWLSASCCACCSAVGPVLIGPVQPVEP